MQYSPIKGRNDDIFKQAHFKCSHINVVEHQYVHSYTTK